MIDSYLDQPPRTLEELKRHHYPKTTPGVGEFYHDSHPIVLGRYRRIRSEKPEFLADAVQDVYMDLWMQLGELTEEVPHTFTGAPALGWVTQAVWWKMEHHRRRDVINERIRFPSLSALGRKIDGEEYPEGSPGGIKLSPFSRLHFGVDGGYEQAEAKVVLDAVLPQLVDNERRVLEARRLDLDVIEIGAQMGMDQREALYVNKQAIVHARQTVELGALRKIGRPPKRVSQVPEGLVG